jgi:hypothetical protein
MDWVHCDACGKTGHRPRFHPAPNDWLYLEAKDKDAPNPDKTTIYVYACSVACALELWKEGPGPRWTPKEILEGEA